MIPICESKMKFTIRAWTFLLFLSLPVTGLTGEESTSGAASPARRASILSRLAAAHPELSAQDLREFPMKIRSLLSDPYTFFRGTCHLFYERCATWEEYKSNDVPRVLLHGDVHIGNLGTMNVGSLKNPRAQFGPIDLDETFEGPFDLDLLRAMTAMRFAAGPIGVEGSDVNWPGVAETLCAAYAEGIEGRITTEDLAQRHEAIASVLRRAAAGSLESYLGRYTEKHERFRAARRTGSGVRGLMEPVSSETRRELLESVFAAIRPTGQQASLCDLGFEEVESWSAAVLDVRRWTRVGSSGSQGVRKYLMLVRVPGTGALPFVFEIKEQPGAGAARAGLIASVPVTERGAFVAGAHPRLLGGPSDCVGSAALSGKSFLLRIKGPWEEDLGIDDFKSKAKSERIPAMASVLGHTLGIAHRRSCPAEGRSEIMDSILKRIPALPETLSHRSEVLESALRFAFEELRNDRDAVELAERASRFLADAAKAGQP
jgi:uncharacterized protein (DUF2252 family)